MQVGDSLIPFQLSAVSVLMPQALDQNFIWPDPYCQHTYALH